MASHSLDNSTSFPIPTYVIIKDDIITEALQQELDKVDNLTIIQKPCVLNVQELSVFL